MDGQAHGGTTSASMAQAPRSRLAADLLVLGGFCAYLFFFGLARFGLVGADEPRYAQIAREMLARHDWIVPVLHGQPWLEKPVLYYWEAMLSYRVFGVSDWAARFPVACSATVMVAAIYFFMRRFRRGTELQAALVAASSAAIIGYGRAASTDMPLTAAFTIALLGWAGWHLTQRRRWLSVFFVFIALGALAKGPVAPFLAALIIVAYAIARRDGRIILRTLWWPGILLFLAVTLPWYILVQTRVPEFFRFFILQHNLARYGSNEFHHPGPFWYYLAVFALGLVPWTAYSITALGDGIRHSRADAQTSQQQAALNLFLVFWALLPVIFFSFSASKLPGYILPAIPPCALLLAGYLERSFAAGARPHIVLVLLHAAICGALLGAALVAQFLIAKVSIPAGAWRLAGGAAAVVFAAVAVTLWRGAGDPAQAMKIFRFVTLVPVILALAFVLRIAGPVLDAVLSARPVAQEIARLETQRGTVALLDVRREIEYGLGFYRNQRILRYGRDPVPAQDHLLIVPSGDVLAAAARLPGRRLSHVGGFAPQGLEFYWVSTPPPMPAGEHHMEMPMQDGGSMAMPMGDMDHGQAHPH